MLTGYNFYYCLPVKSKRGGVGMYVRCELSISERTDLQIQKIEGIENLWYDVACGNRTYVIGGIYKHPKYRTLDFIDKLEPILNKISSSKHSSLIAGNFNIDLSKCNSDKITGDYINMLFSNNFLPTIIMLTRIAPKSATIIDHIYTEHCSVWFNQLIDYYGQDDARKRMTEKRISTVAGRGHCSVRSSVCVLVIMTGIIREHL